MVRAKEHCHLVAKDPRYHEGRESPCAPKGPQRQKWLRLVLILSKWDPNYASIQFRVGKVCQLLHKAPEVQIWYVVQVRKLPLGEMR